ncbi:MAG: AP endonuclease [Thermoplasmata archaeon]|nr:MAG: AP endonuclease [Thermoplasmata archaeon]
MYRFGPAGIPLSCKGRKLINAVEEVMKSGLNALEVQFIRFYWEETPVTKDMEGMVAREAPELGVVLDVLTQTDGGYVYAGPEKVLEEGDIVIHLPRWNLASSYQELEDVARIAKEFDVMLSAHSPYYMELTGTGEGARRSIEEILWSAYFAQVLGADLLVNKTGLYMGLSREEAMQNMIRNIKEIQREMRRRKIKVKLGFEISGKPEVFGDKEELFELSKRLKIIPVLNFPYLHAREYGKFRRANQFLEALEEFRGHLHGLKRHYVRFAGVEHEAGRELRLLPIKRGDLRFEIMAEALAELDYDITIISISPLLEHDAKYMKIMLERVFARRVK